jgi:hypothetical protein
LYAAIAAAWGVARVEVAGADGAGSPGRAAGSVDDEHPTTTTAVAAMIAARCKIRFMCSPFQWWEGAQDGLEDS